MPAIAICPPVRTGAEPQVSMTVAMATGRPDSSQERAAARGSVTGVSDFAGTAEGQSSVTGSSSRWCYTVAIALGKPQG
jgi:hypothetical protein